MAAPLKTFIIYARADDAAKSQLIRQLRPLINRKSLEVWHDGNILPGEEWDAAIKRELKNSELVLFLVSADSLNSDYIQSRELKTALERLAAGLTRIVPIVVAPCAWKFDTILSGLQALPLYKAEGVKPVRSWADPDEAWASVVDHLGEMVLELQHRRDQEDRDRAATAAATQQSQAESERIRREEALRAQENERLRQAQEAQQRRDADAAAQKKQEQERQLREQEAAEQRRRDAEAERTRQREAAALLAWGAAETTNTMDGYETFARDYPNHANAREARYRAKQLRQAGKKPLPVRTLVYGSGGLIAVLLALWLWNRSTAQEPPTVLPNTPVQAAPAKDSIPGMVFVQGGTFQMGSTNGESDEKPLHSVTVSDFYLGKCEVTVGEYLKFADATKANYPEWLEKANKYNVETGTDTYYKEKGYSRSASNLPIVGVSWNDVVAYCAWMTAQNPGKIYRLPTEAEWEYAARGGSQGEGYTYAGSNSLDEVAWHRGNADGKPHPVEQKKSNKLGLYDMSGNVWEWCSDWYALYPSGSQNNPQGAASGDYRVFRGGSWNRGADDCRVSVRSSYFTPVYRRNYLGFRLVSSSQ